MSVPNIPDSLAACDHVLDGEAEIGPQFHFYMENNVRFDISHVKFQPVCIDWKKKLPCTVE